MRTTIPRPAQQAAGTGTPEGQPGVPRVRTRRTAVLASLIGLVLAAFLVDLVFGSVAVPLSDVVTVLLGGRPSNPTWTNIIMIYRLGLMFGYLASSLVSLLLYFADAQRVQSYVIWTFGTFDSVTWPQMSVFLPAMLIAVLVGMLSVKSLNALLLGEAYARSLGLNVRRARLVIIAGVALLVGTATAFCGPIAFIGIAVPHLCRGLLNTSDHRVLMPATLLLGAVVALVSDLVAQLPGTGTVLPLNAVTALLGAPVVGWVILRRRAQRAVFV